MENKTEEIICKRCGKCCKEMFFTVDRADTPGGLDHLEWARCHGLNIEFRRDDTNAKWWGVCLSKTCLELSVGNDGIATCSSYKERPDMCRDYSCRIDVDCDI